jgi:hypothetical protein
MLDILFVGAPAVSAQLRQPAAAIGVEICSRLPQFG